jgi:hypothetical protein
MKTNILLFWVFGTVAVQVHCQEPIVVSEPKELIQLRNAWIEERHKVTEVLDEGYLESLDTMKARLEKIGNHKAVAAVDREIQGRLAATAQRIGKLSNTAYAKADPLNKVKLSVKEREGLEEKLAGKIWRVDHEGEGLRWYYFQEGGKAARKSGLTNWMWSELDGRWVMDDKGNVTVTCPGRTVQIFMGSNGTPQITLNRKGVLTVRPFVETDLTYPGAGKE